MGVSTLMNNTAKISFGEDSVKIRPAVAEQLHRKKKQKHETATKISNGAFGCSEQHRLTSDIIIIVMKQLFQ